MALWTTLKEKLKGVTERWGESIASLFSGKALDEAFWDELEERLLAGDVGIDTTTALLEEMRRGATERRIGEDGFLQRKRKTLMFNGYGEQVASLYAGMDLKRFF